VAANTTAGTGFMQSPSRRTIRWYLRGRGSRWANTLFGELTVRLARSGRMSSPATAGIGPEFEGEEDGNPAFGLALVAVATGSLGSQMTTMRRVPSVVSRMRHLAKRRGGCFSGLAASLVMPCFRAAVYRLSAVSRQPQPLELKWVPAWRP